MLARDFNLTLVVNEKKGGKRVSDPFKELLEDIIQDWDLVDIKPKKGKYTWSNKRIGPGYIATRLGKFTVQIYFLISRVSLSSYIIPFSVSDHKPISLDISKDANLGPIPLHFNPIRGENKDSFKVVLEAWNIGVRGSTFFV